MFLSDSNDTNLKSMFVYLIFLLASYKWIFFSDFLKLGIYKIVFSSCSHLECSNEALVNRPWNLTNLRSVLVRRFKHYKFDSTVDKSEGISSCLAEIISIQKWNSFSCPRMFKALVLSSISICVFTSYCNILVLRKLSIILKLKVINRVQ